MGGALALDAAWLFAAFLIILVLVAAGIAARRFLLERGGGTVECGLRRGNGIPAARRSFCGSFWKRVERYLEGSSELRPRLSASILP